jgi:glycosyltransferase involved in cell wall biosynthesis
MRTVVIVIPAYNEAGRIGAVIRSIPRTIKAGRRRYASKVVVVDDGSHDATSEEALQNGATVMRHVINLGAGGATRTGLHYAERLENVAYVVTIDADGQHSSDDVARIVEYANDHDAELVVGNRLHTGNKASMPLHRTLGNRGLSLFSRILFGIDSEDTQSGLRLFKSSIVPQVSAYSIDRYGFCTEMLWLARRHGIPIQEMPISVHYSSETLNKGQSNWGVVHLFVDLIWIRVSR